MNKKLFLAIFSIVMIIAYIDLIDSFKYFESIMSQMIKLDTDIKTNIDTSNIKTQK